MSEEIPLDWQEDPRIEPIAGYYIGHEACGGFGLLDKELGVITCSKCDKVLFSDLEVRKEDG